MNSEANLQLIDLKPTVLSFKADVLQGLAQEQKRIPAKYFYDDLGSDIFEKICVLPEYYVTRTEMSIYDSIDRIVSTDQNVVIIELGGASSAKFRRLCRNRPEVKRYISIDISRDALFASATKLSQDFPNLDVIAIAADYQHLTDIHLSSFIDGLVPIVFFPGSTIGNLSADEAVELMRFSRNLVGNQGYFLLSADLLKSDEVLVPAYNDKSGVTADFNLNVLQRINRELGGNFKPELWQHQARFNPQESKIEMHLVSLSAQIVNVGGKSFSFKSGETIHTEDSRKYTTLGIKELADQSGYQLVHYWSDPLGYFGVFLLDVAELHLNKQQNCTKQVTVDSANIQKVY